MTGHDEPAADEPAVVPVPRTGPHVAPAYDAGEWLAARRRERGNARNGKIHRDRP